MSRKQWFTVGELTMEGASNGTVTVLAKDANQRVLICTGTSVPSAVSGYAKGCLFIKTDAGNGVKSLYENTGTTSSCSFDLIGSISAGEISLAEGNVLVGNAAGVAAALSAKTDGRILIGNGTTITSAAVSGDITITNAGVTAIGAKKVLDSMVAIADTKVLIGGADGAAHPFALSGDITMTNGGVTAIGAKKVLESMVAVADGSFLIGGADGAAHAFALSGDITSTNGGVTAIGAKKVLESMVAVADTKYLVGGADGAAHAFALSGDVTSTNGGVVTIAAGVVTRAKQSTAAASKNIPLVSATVATTGNTDGYVIAPQTGTLTGVDFSGTDALAADDTNYVTFSITNLGQAGAGSTAMLAATDANTTKATGGTALVANGKRSLTLHGTAANLDVTAGDRLLVRAAASGTLANTVTFPAYMLRFGGTT